MEKSLVFRVYVAGTGASIIVQFPSEVSTELEIEVRDSVLVRRGPLPKLLFFDFGP
jgi:hypothetical protein